MESFSGIDAMLAAFTPLLFQRYQQYQADVREGGRALYPNEATSSDLSHQLRQMEQARSAGERAVLTSHMDVEQLRARALRAGMPTGRDPQNFWYAHPFSGNFWHGLATDFRGRGAFLGSFFSIASYRASVAAREGVQREEYLNFLRERGLIGLNEQFQPRMDFNMPGVQAVTQMRYNISPNCK